MESYTNLWDSLFLFSHTRAPREFKFRYDLSARIEGLVIQVTDYNCINHKAEAGLGSGQNYDN